MLEDGIDVKDYPRDPVGLEKAYSQNPDFYGNGRRGVFKAVAPSLITFLEQNTSLLRKVDRTGVVNYGVPVRWCDIGIGGGWCMQAVMEEGLKRDYLIEPSGVDVAASAVANCQRMWPGYDFRVQNMDEQWSDDMPWRQADVVAFMEVLYMFKDYRKTFDRVYAELRPGTVIVVSDLHIRHHRRVYPKSIPDCAFLGSWADRSIEVVPHRFTKFAVYRKML